MRAEKTLRRDNVGAGNWKGAGMWAWILHRVTGVILAIYLFLHLTVIASQSDQPGENVFEAFETDLFIILDLFLTAAVVYHAVNGVRVLLFDLGIGTGRHKTLFYAALVASAAIVAPFAYATFYFIANGEGPW